MKLKGKRITLRLFTKKDEKRLAELANDKSVNRFTHVPYPYNLKMAKEFIKSSNERFRKKQEYHFAIALNEADEFIGTIGLIRISKRDNRAEIGYWLGKPYRGKGYTTEACRLLIDFGFKKLKFNKIVIVCAKENKSSKRVIDKVGAKLEGVLKKDAFIGGHYRDCLIHGILRKEWEKNGRTKILTRA